MSEIAGYSNPPPRLPRALTHNAEILMLRLWRRGLDTYAIAQQLGYPEHQIANHLPRLREQSRNPVGA
jgi:DNA-binding CsgD family transcriptional regulator